MAAESYHDCSLPLSSYLLPLAPLPCYTDALYGVGRREGGNLRPES